jgi:divalent metal cation (Fe/Co/Zn/Cd) transporter
VLVAITDPVRKALLRRGFALEYARVTMVDGILASAVLAGLVLNAALGWWWADPAAGYVLVFYAAREVRDIFFPAR